MNPYPTVKDKSREAEFKQKLQALLEEYGVEMEVKCKPETVFINEKMFASSGDYREILPTEIIRGR